MAGFTKEDKLTPVITLTVYWGCEEWDAEAMKIIRKYKISSERLQMLNKLSEDEVRNLLQKREQEKEVSINEKQEIIG